MNPVDHPHGGRTNGGCPSVTPWGLPTKGGKKVFVYNGKNFRQINITREKIGFKF
eukprot:gene27438-36094_t